jgi:hypothetical protein
LKKLTDHQEIRDQVSLTVFSHEGGRTQPFMGSFHDLHGRFYCLLQGGLDILFLLSGSPGLGKTHIGFAVLFTQPEKSLGQTTHLIQQFLQEGLNFRGY